jgi:hypothetical protein
MNASSSSVNNPNPYAPRAHRPWQDTACDETLVNEKGGRWASSRTLTIPSSTAVQFGCRTEKQSGMGQTPKSLYFSRRTQGAAVDQPARDELQDQDARHRVPARPPRRAGPTTRACRRRIAAESDLIEINVIVGRGPDKVGAPRSKAILPEPVLARPPLVPLRLRGHRALAHQPA